MQTFLINSNDYQTFCIIQDFFEPHLQFLSSECIRIFDEGEEMDEL